MGYYLYILYSKNIDRFYIGSSGDLKSRIDRHNRSSPGFTGKANDWILVHSEEFQTVTEARARELQIKKWKSRKIIENIISANPSKT